MEGVTQSITVTRNVLDKCVSRAEGGEQEAQYRPAQMFFLSIESSAIVPLLNRSESHSTAEGPSAFTLNSDGVITDRETGKQWLEKAVNHGDVRTKPSHC